MVDGEGKEGERKEGRKEGRKGGWKEGRKERTWFINTQSTMTAISGRGYAAFNSYLHINKNESNGTINLFCFCLFLFVVVVDDVVF